VPAGCQGRRARELAGPAAAPDDARWDDGVIGTIQARPPVAAKKKARGVGRPELKEKGSRMGRRNRAAGEGYASSAAGARALPAPSSSWSAMSASKLLCRDRA
jgi:hypothetical protein